LATGTLAALSSTARAQCGRPDLIDMIPPNGATGVPPNAMLGAHYAPSTAYLGEDVVLVHPDGSEQLLDATWDKTEKFLSVTPTSPLASSSTYEIRWPILRGINAAAPGQDGKSRFTTGTAFDDAAPTFAGVAGLSWDLERVEDLCIDELVERFVFDIDLGAASDDGGTDELTLLLFQTSGPTVKGMPMALPGRAWPKEGMRAQVKLATGDSVGQICFAGIVRDTLGRISQSGDVVACVQTTDPPFFRGCNLSGQSGGDGVPLAALAILALLLRRRTR
jgi:hypothetical protein